jgi:hypothetical protein
MGNPSVTSVLTTLSKDRTVLVGRELGFTVSPELTKEQQLKRFAELQPLPRPRARRTDPRL